MAGMLEGYRVLDFGRYISGPFCGALLADLGAEVIRIEPPGGADDRYVMSLSPDGEGALHRQVNRGKRSLTLDLGAKGASLVLDPLLRTADIVLANMPPAALRKLGLDYQSLTKARENIILTTINAYGAEGAFVDEVGFDGTGQALSGAQALTGTPDQPFRSAVSYVDYATAMSAALGTVAALLRRERTGRGEHVQCSLLGTALTMTNPMLIEEAAGARSRVATGNRSPIAGPSDLFRTLDGWVMVQVIGQAMFRRWTALVGRPDLIDDPRFSGDANRGTNGEELSAITAGWAQLLTSEECVSTARSYRLPATKLLTPAEALHAPEVVTGGFLHYQDWNGLPALPIVAAPFRFGDVPGEPPTPAPDLDADTGALLRDLAVPPATIARLARDGVVGASALKSCETL